MRGAGLAAAGRRHGGLNGGGNFLQTLPNLPRALCQSPPASSGVGRAWGEPAGGGRGRRDRQGGWGKLSTQPSAAHSQQHPPREELAGMTESP